MGSQFVDLNADGFLDYLTATFDGSPHIAYGSKDGFAEPAHLFDVERRRIIISSIWNYEKETHEDVGYAMADGQAQNLRCISALAFDWDADGDFDLLLGSYEEGRLYLMKNEGTKSEPKFKGPIEPIMAGGVPFELPAKMTTPRLVDWDGDGDMDLIAGTFSDSFSYEGEGGGVYLAINRGKPGAPLFGRLRPIIAPVAKGGNEPVRADAGLYPEPFDFDGDGDLDLLVGAYSLWTPKPPELNAEQTARAEELKQQKAKIDQRRKDLNDRRNKAVATATEGLHADPKAMTAKIEEVFKTFEDESRAVMEEWSAINKELEPMIGAPQRRGFIWLYERL